MNASLQAVIAATKFSPSLITPKASGQWDSLLECRIRMYGRECGCGREGHILMCHHPGKRAAWTVIVSVLARYYKSIYYKTAFLPKYTGRFTIVYLSSSSENAPKSDPAALLLTFLAHLPFRILRKGISLHIFSGGTIYQAHNFGKGMPALFLDAVMFSRNGSSGSCLPGTPFQTPFLYIMISKPGNKIFRLLVNAEPTFPEVFY